MEMGERFVVVFNRAGGTLGRASGNHFELPDSERAVSGTHALIRYENGRYYLEDTSSNGTFIYKKNLTLHRKSVQLDDGDRLKIGDYDLVVSITEKPRSGNEPLLGSTNDPPYPAHSPGLPPDFDIGALLNGLADVEQQRADAYSPRGGNVSPQYAAFEPPNMVRAPEHSPGLPPDFDIGGLLDGLDDAGEVRAKVEPTESAVPKAIGVPTDNEAGETPPPVPLNTSHQSGVQSYDDLFRVFLEGAGLQELHVLHQAEIPALLRTAGALLREAIVGLGTMLRGRAASTSSLRAAITTMQATHNNPLKFAVPEEALTLLLTNSHPGSIDGVEAVREGCADLIHHDLALTAGIQAAVRGLLERFDPQQVAKLYAEGIVLQRKAKCWDAYRQAYKKTVAEVLEDFFGDAFVRAYEEQLGKLRSQDHKR
jgi:type VI secretion system FHA domain protein